MSLQRGTVQFNVKRRHSNAMFGHASSIARILAERNGTQCYTSMLHVVSRRDRCARMIYSQVLAIPLQVETWLRKGIELRRSAISWDFFRYIHMYVHTYVIRDRDAILYTRYVAYYSICTDSGSDGYYVNATTTKKSQGQSWANAIRLSETRRRSSMAIDDRKRGVFTVWRLIRI